MAGNGRNTAGAGPRRRPGAKPTIRAALAAILAAATGCAGGDYLEMYDLPVSGWPADRAVVFRFRPDSAQTAEGGSRWIDLAVRHTPEFPYTDLLLEVKGVAPDKSFWTDTVSLPLGTTGGNGVPRWAGRAYSNHYDFTCRYRSGIRYGAAGGYALSIRQLTDGDTLRGILSVGIVACGAKADRPR